MCGVVPRARVLARAAGDTQECISTIRAVTELAFEVVTVHLLASFLLSQGKRHVCKEDRAATLFQPPDPDGKERWGEPHSFAHRHVLRGSEAVRTGAPFTPAM